MPLTNTVELPTLARLAKGYSGADIAALCREAGMLVLRKSGNGEEVTMEDFKKALDIIGPSITSEMDNWYRGVAKQFRKPIKPATPIS